MSTDACPPADQLSRFALGTLPEPALETIARHLDGCPACEAAVKALDQLSDPVLTALRHCPAGPSPPASS